MPTTVRPGTPSHFHLPLMPIFIVKISVILVFTKFNLLIKEHFKHVAHCGKEERKQKAQAQAQAGFEQAETDVQHSHGQVRCVRVSTQVKPGGPYFSFSCVRLFDMSNIQNEMKHSRI